jgi:hypothetical protein
VKRSDIIKQVWQEFVAFAYLENADRLKYGTLIAGLSNQFSLGQNQYPKELTDATNILSNHKFDSTYKEHNRNNTNMPRLRPRQAKRRMSSHQESCPLLRLRADATAVGTRSIRSLNAPKPRLHPRKIG